MAVDTRNKRFSMIGIDMPFLRVFPNPDGTISAEDRQQYLGKYSGIPFSGDTPVAFIPRLPLLGVG